MGQQATTYGQIGCSIEATSLIPLIYKENRGNSTKLAVLLR